MTDLTDLLLWIGVGAVGGFYYGRRKFANWFWDATSTQESLEAFKKSGEQGKAFWRGYRLAVRLFFAGVGALAGAAIWGIGELLAHM